MLITFLIILVGISAFAALTFFAALALIAKRPTPRPDALGDRTPPDQSPRISLPASAAELQLLKTGELSARNGELFSLPMQGRQMSANVIENRK